MDTSSNYADGNVITITMGASEFSSILSSATSRNQLVLLDFSASWCGPCKMLSPILSNFAREYVDRLIVCKMDCEQTAANRDLASQNSISAFPTIQLYRSGSVVEIIRGANPPAIKQAIIKHLNLLNNASGSGGTTLDSNTASGSGALATNLAVILSKLKQNCSFDEFISATKALVTYVRNVVDHPTDLKYRKIKKNNTAFQTRLGNRVGGVEALHLLGFKERIEGMGPVLVMDDIHPQLASVVSLLQQAIGIRTEPSTNISNTANNSNTATNSYTATNSNTANQQIAELARTMNRTLPTSLAGTHQENNARPRRVRISVVALARVLEQALIDSGC